MIRRVLLLALALAIGFGSTACESNNPTAPESPIDDPPGAATASDLQFCLDETNRYRALGNRSAVSHSQSLSDASDSRVVWADVRYESRSRRSDFKTTNGKVARIVDIRLRIDCGVGKMAEIDAVWRDARGVSLDEVHRASIMGADVPTPTGSMNAMVIYWICENAPPPPRTEASTEPPTTSTRSEPGKSSGSAFAVHPTSLLTNNHVVEDCSSVTLTGVAGIALKGMIQARDSRNDLALILVDRRLDSIAAFRARPARSGEDVIALGFPLSGLLAQDLNVSTGIVSATAGLLNDTSRLQISAAVQPGNSGGPLLDSAGAVVGVVVSKLNALAVARAIGDIPQNINFAIKAPIAEVFLRSQRVEPRIAGTTAVVVVAVADVVDAARAYTFLVECDPELLCLFGASL